MNADRIIVVTGGEIVEQGSHDELIGADGKYAELWSKQVFVKPKDKEAHEDKPAGKGRKALGIVNDLSAEATTSELAKVKSTPTTNGQTNGQVDNSDSTVEGNGRANDKPNTPAHGKEV